MKRNGGTTLMNKYTAQASTVSEAIEKALKELSLLKEDAVIQVIEEGRKGFLGIGQKDAVVSVSRKEPTLLSDNFLPKTTLNLDTKEPLSVTVEPTESYQIEQLDRHTISKSTKIVENVPEEKTGQQEKDEQAKKEKQNERAIEQARVYLETIGKHMGADPIKVYVKQEKQRVTFTIETDKAGLMIGRHGKVLNAIESLVQVVLYKEAGSKLNAVVDTEDYRDREQETLEKLAERTAQRVIRTQSLVKLEPMPANERKLIHHYLSKEPLVATKSEGKEPYRYLTIEPAERVKDTSVK